MKISFIVFIIDNSTVIVFYCSTNLYLHPYMMKEIDQQAEADCKRLTGEHAD